MAVYVQKILQGAKPGELPVKVNHYELYLNQNTARQLGIVLPDSVLKRADKVLD